MGFEKAGFVVVQGPDAIWGRSIREFHPPAGRFDGVIGGPPCPSHSRLRHTIEANEYEPEEDLISEFERVVVEAAPRWWLSENAPASRCPSPRGYWNHSQVVSNRSLGEVQDRKRRICFGRADGPAHLEVPTVALERVEYEHAVTADPRPVPVAIGGSGKRKPGADLPKRSLARCLELQGIPAGIFDRSPYTMQAKRKLVGNAVPLPMAEALGRAVAKAVAYSPDSCT
jgi:DNA (cytosine-5)-methyltransferase 1